MVVWYMVNFLYLHGVLSSPRIPKCYKIQLVIHEHIHMLPEVIYTVDTTELEMVDRG